MSTTFRFGTFVAGNVHNPDIGSGASRFASAIDLSQLSIGGTITLADNHTFEAAFGSSIYYSVVSAYPVAIVGGKAL
jgi:hypothetical protein